MKFSEKVKAVLFFVAIIVFFCISPEPKIECINYNCTVYNRTLFSKYKVYQKFNTYNIVSYDIESKKTSSKSSSYYYEVYFKMRDGSTMSINLLDFVSRDNAVNFAEEIINNPNYNKKFPRSFGRF